MRPILKSKKIEFKEEFYAFTVKDKNHNLVTLKDYGAELYVQILVDESEIYFVPIYYLGPDEQRFRLKTHGNFNAVYFPCDDHGKFLDRPKEYVFKSPFSLDEITDLPERIVRLWNDYFRAHPELTVGDAKLYGQGCLVPRIDVLRNADARETKKIMYDFFVAKRIFMDGLVPGNVVVRKGDEAVLPIDLGNVIKFSAPLDLDKSLTSVEVMSCQLGRYLPWLFKRQADLKYTENALFTLALIGLLALDLNLKDPSCLLKSENNGFIKRLATLVVLNPAIHPTLPDSALFCDDAKDNLKQRNDAINQLSTRFSLTPDERIYLRVNPSVVLYEEPLRCLSYLPIKFDRLDILTEYVLTDEKFFHIAAFLLLRGDDSLKTDFSKFAAAFKKQKSKETPDCYFLALKRLSEKASKNASCEPFHAYNQLKGRSQTEVELLVRPSETEVEAAAPSNDLVRLMPMKAALSVSKKNEKKNGCPGLFCTVM